MTSDPLDRIERERQERKDETCRVTSHGHDQLCVPESEDVSESGDESGSPTSSECADIEVGRNPLGRVDQAQAKLETGLQIAHEEGYGARQVCEGEPVELDEV